MKKIICFWLMAVLFSLSIMAIDAPSVEQDSSIRTEAPISLRVKANMSLQDSRSDETIEYGFLITRRKLLHGAGLENDGLTLDSDVYYIKGVSKSSEVDRYFAIEEDTLYYTALVRGIEQRYYDDILVVRTYIVTEKEILYGDAMEFSLYKTAKQIKNDAPLFSDFTEKQKDVINEIVYTVDGYPKEYTVDFIVDKSVFDSQIITEGEKITELKTPTKDGYKFLGWSLEESGELVDADLISITENTMFYAVFERIPVYYNVTFMHDETEYEIKSVLENTTVQMPSEPNKENCIFLGWSTLRDGNIVNLAEYLINENTVLYAVFQEKTKYTVCFFYGESVVAEYEVYEGGVTEIPEQPVLPSNLEFVGWSLLENGDAESLICEGDRIIDCDKNFYAVVKDKRVSDPQLIEILKKGREELKRIRISNANQRKARTVLVECMSLVVEDAENGIYVDKDYILVYYEEYVLQVRDIIKVQMTEIERSNFLSMLANTKNISGDVQDFLKVYFDIEVSDVA